MNVKKNYLEMVVLAYFIASFISCTVQDINTEYSTSIDLSLAEENDWIMSEDILDHINDYRLEKNLNILSVDSSFATAYAVSHSKYMIETQSINHNNFFIRSNGLKQKGAISVGENVAYGYSTAESVVNAWLNSEGHREMIIGDFTNIGFGILKSETNNKFYYTTIFYK
jgi:uncharacterized protein YkwD